MKRPHLDSAHLFFSILKPISFKKLNGTGQRRKFPNSFNLHLIFVFIFIFYFFYICFFIFIILKLIYFIKNKNIMNFINYLLQNILIIIIINYIKI